MAIEDTKAVWPGWETVGMIGRGSFGAVYEIQREIFDDVEKAALKMISIPQNASDIDELYSDGFDDESISSTFKGYLKSIVAEYTMMQKLSGCTNIVNCQDLRYVPHDDGVGWDIFIKMELLTPLTKALPAHVPEETVIQIAKDICAALQLCKKHGIVHRDIKPQNIFMSPNGDFKLGDFGIAKTVEKTTGGTKIGTYKFMAPEVYHSKPYGTASDIYSLGLVLYWLLNERRMPFMPLPPQKLTAGINEASRNRRLSGEPFPEPKNGSKALKAIVMKACAYNTEDRYASAEEMFTDLNRMGQEEKAVMEQPAVPVLLEQEKAEAVPPAEKKKTTDPEPKQDKKKWLMLLGTAVLMLAAVLAVLLPGKEKETEDEPPVVQNQVSEPAQTQEEIQPTQAPTEAVRELPEGTLLVEGSWENGDVVVVALDAKTLWIQITDHRPDQQYADLGTPWSIGLGFGEEMTIENSAGGYADHPFRIGLESPAARGMMAYEYEQGNTGENFSPEHLKNLWFTQTEATEYGFAPVNMERFDYLDMQRKANTYTSVITLPEWFDVSVYNDLAFVDISLYTTNHYAKLYQNESVRLDGFYHFYPSKATESPETVAQEEAVKDVVEETPPAQENKPAHNPNPEPVEPDSTPTDDPVIDNGEPPVEVMPDEEPAVSIPPVPEHNPKPEPEGPVSKPLDDPMIDLGEPPVVDIPDPDA